MFKFFLFLYALPLLASMQSITITPPHYNQKYITILDAKKVTFKKRKHHPKFCEISDLAYDKKSKTLYALSDRSALFKLLLQIKNNTITQLKLLRSYKIAPKMDTEGLDFKKGNLLISTERKPRILLYTTEAQFIKKIKLPKKLQNKKAYQSKNKQLEGICYTKKYGTITAPELPLNHKKHHTLYSKKRAWIVPMHGAITALENIQKSKVLIVEREYHLLYRTITLSLFNLKNENYTHLLTMDTRDGWSIDNIEGITKLKRNYFLLISDDNDSFLQKTQLILFKLDKSL